LPDYLDPSGFSQPLEMIANERLLALSSRTKWNVRTLIERKQNEAKSEHVGSNLNLIKGKPPAVPVDSQSLTFPGVYESPSKCEPLKIHRKRGFRCMTNRV